MVFNSLLFRWFEALLVLFPNLFRFADKVENATRFLQFTVLSVVRWLRAPLRCFETPRRRTARTCPAPRRPQERVGHERGVHPLLAMEAWKAVSGHQTFSAGPQKALIYLVTAANTVARMVVTAP